MDPSRRGAALREDSTRPAWPQFPVPTPAGAGTLEDVREHGALGCGVSTGLAGFAFTDDGNWTGFDPAICQAVAAAVFGDPARVEYTPTTGETRFEALKFGEIDILARVTTWTFTRDVDLKLTFAGINYYDGQGFMVPCSLGVASALDLDGASVCIQTGTTSELNLSDYFRVHDNRYEDEPVQPSNGAGGALKRGRTVVHCFITAARRGLVPRQSVFRPRQYPAHHRLLWGAVLDSSRPAGLAVVGCGVRCGPPE